MALRDLRVRSFASSHRSKSKSIVNWLFKIILLNEHCVWYGLCIFKLFHFWLRSSHQLILLLVIPWGRLLDFYADSIFQSSQEELFVAIGLIILKDHVDHRVALCHLLLKCRSFLLCELRCFDYMHHLFNLESFLLLLS